MTQIGRNERCPCGSGKKYKRCCGATKQMIRCVSTPDYQTTLRLVPRLISWVQVELNEVSLAAVEEWRQIVQTLGDSNSLVQRSDVDFLLRHVPDTFISDSRVGGIVAHREPTFFQTCWYWNTIDQQVHELRTQLVKLFSTELRSLMTARFDRIRSASRARLLYEIGLRAISMIMITKLSYGLSELQQIDTYFSFNSSLSKFLWSSLYLTDSDRKLLFTTLDQEYSEGLAWLTTDYAPTVIQQQDLAKFFAEAIVKKNGDNRLQNELKSLSNSYRVLCKLVHPSGWMFHGRKQVANVSDNQIDDAIKSCCMKVASISSRWMSLLDDRFWGERSFMEAVEQRITNGAIRHLVAKIPEIDDMLEKYKEVRIGDYLVHQLDPLTKNGRSVALKYQGLTEAQKLQVKNLIDSFVGQS